MYEALLIGGSPLPGVLGGEPLEVKETHISVVVLGAERVLKLKKPVDYGFLDYTTLEKRKAACEAEVRLNSRLCARLYLGVVPIQSSATAPVSDYGVLMRRLPANRMLDALVRSGAVTEAMVDRVVSKLAEFHRAADRSPEINAYGSPETIARNWEENFRQTEPYVGRTIEPEAFHQIRRWVQERLAADRPLFERRIEEGHVVDGHGDVRCESICLDGEVCFFDCIEFNERFRCGDVAAEIAFLAMDLNSLGRPDLAHFATERYVHHSGDAGLWRVLPLYLCYRAWVRGKVMSFRLSQQGIADADKTEAQRRATNFFDLARRYAVTPAPAMVVVCGRSGTGKTTIARGLAHESGFRLLSTDAVRLELLGPAKGPSRFGEGAYRKEVTEHVYRTLTERADTLLAEGSGAVLDGTFLEQPQREALAALARQRAVRVNWIECVLEPQAVRNRLASRAASGDGNSDATWQIYARQRMQEPAAGQAWCRLDTGAPVAGCVRQASTWLREKGRVSGVQLEKA